MIKIGVISDIHSHEKDNKQQQGGYYFPSMPDDPIEKNPFSALKKLIRENSLELDYLLSPGDYAHQIDDKGLKSAWDQLKLIHHEVKSKLLIGTIGNHDVASRDAEKDSFDYIKKFDTCFPLYPSNPNDDSSRNQLLENSFFVYEDSDLDIFFIVLNSCFDHWNEIDASRGKIKTDKINEIQKAINDSNNEKKILLIHHNPIIHQAWGNDNDFLEDSEKLLQNIRGIDLIIYGHKHNFRFEQREIYPKNLSLLASGSFSCFKTSLARNDQNTFHIVEFDCKKMEFCENQGFVKTYEYNPSDGWNYSNKLLEGFGCTLDSQSLESKIINFLKEQDEHYMNWSDIVTDLPFLQYVSKKNRNLVFENLQKKGDVIKVLYTDRGELESLILK
ncbi:metallophosphoesterase [Aquimarina sp. Aq107]|uniref:metallophosphoesterase family protein n=1 Tax=Aquimarina sp. Aq107 TaxID=1191912 RepID=UPI000D562074|nr:metallophosphoesterase [Aquimarina sp. Aq107]